MKFVVTDSSVSLPANLTSVVFSVDSFKRFLKTILLNPEMGHPSLRDPLPVTHGMAITSFHPTHGEGYGMVVLDNPLGLESKI